MLGFWVGIAQAKSDQKGERQKGGVGEQEGRREERRRREDEDQVMQRMLNLGS